MGSVLSTSLRALSDASHVGQKKHDGLPRCDRNDAVRPLALFTVLFAAAALSLASSAFAQTPAADPAAAQLSQQLRKIMGKKASPEMLGQVMVIGSLLGCTQKSAGKEATNVFYQRMQAVGKRVESYCKKKQPEQARALLLSTVTQNKNNPVVTSALGCYDAQADSMAAMGGEQLAANAAHYARWMRDPAAATKEITEADVCRGKKLAAAAPVTH